jgi:diaminopimelate decarboxylase
MMTKWETLNRLETLHGDSFYLLDKGGFARNHQEFRDAFAKIYRRTILAYSYKTNYAPALCRLNHDMGGWAEVVSGMEYELAQKVGVPGENIIFNGPYKPRPVLENALFAGSIVNLDSVYELEAVEEMALRHPDRNFRIGMRCNFDIGEKEVSRFGFDVEAPDFPDLIARVRKCTGGFGGFHCHFSTGSRSTESYSKRIGRLLELTRAHFAETAPDFINVGGGFFSKMDPELQAQFDAPVPGYADYARAIAEPMAEAYPDGGPELIVEPGSAILADVMVFVARVLNLKSIRKRVVAQTSGSIHNVKPTLNSKNLPAEIVRRPGSEAEQDADSYDVTGYTCMENDVLNHQFRGAIGADDYVIVKNVGAYTNVLKPPFIQPGPPILAYDGDLTDEVEVVKRRETFDDVFATYSL